ncbi:hypothetical protein OROHE_017655 [Orobanche hederae]
MANLSSGSSSTIITDLDMDALTRCASYLSLRDISNVAMSCKYLKRAAYSDFIWQSLYRYEWPQAVPPSREVSSFRESYLSRHTALHQFKYADPLLCDIPTFRKPPHHILLDKNAIIFSQGPSIHSLHTEDLINKNTSVATLDLLFSLSEVCLYQRESEKGHNILITSSSDHFIRLWSKGGSRCFKGHTGPVLTLSDKLLGDGTGKILASGGEDGTVRLWSINSSGKRGQHALKATLHGHDKAVSIMSGAGHKASLLVSISKNGKVRVWDTMTASALLWDIRGVSETHRTEPTVELDGHVGPIEHIRMDVHKVVTGGPDDASVRVWETSTGMWINSLICSSGPDELSERGCSAMAVDGCRIVTGGSDYEGNPRLRFRDFKTATCQLSWDLSEEASSGVSRFWGSHSDSSSDSDEATDFRQGQV